MAIYVKTLLATVTVLLAVATSTKAVPTCSPFEDVTHPHEDCTKYYVCSAGQLIIVDCPNPLFWNPEIEECDWSYNVEECVGGTRPPDGTAPPPTSTPPPTTTTRPTTTQTPTTTTPAPTTTGSTTPLPNGCPPVGVDKIPYPGSCVLYFICIDGVPHVTNCTDGQYFNPDIKECDLPGNVDCTEPTTTQAPTTTTRAPTTTTRAPTTTTRAPTTTTPAPTTTGLPTTTTELTPSPEPTETVPTTTQAPDFPCPDLQFVYMQHPTDCERFYVCENGQFTGRVYSCGQDFWFLYTAQSCVSPWADNCRA